MSYTKPSTVHYRLAQLVCEVFAAVIFRRKVLRNEIRRAKGPFVVIANHQAVYDFANLMGLTRRPMSFVISNSFYNSLPIRSFLDKMGVIPKQQFQTTVADMKKMKAVVDAGQPLVIYPAGLMCEDGLSTPIPAATYKFLRWLGVDIYAARVSGTYFAMPKWAKGVRPGRTTLDVYKLIGAEELQAMTPEAVKARVDEALLFDAYRDQEKLRIPYCRCSDLRGLENVLYACPHCGGEHTITTEGTDTLICTACGLRHTADRYGFLHNTGTVGPEIRYVSDWSRQIADAMRRKICEGTLSQLCCTARIHKIDYKSKKFRDVGSARITLTRDQFRLEGHWDGEERDLTVSTAGLPTLPFNPGHYFEIQDGKEIYRCAPDDGRIVMQYINMIKLCHQLNRKAKEKIGT